MDNLIQSVSRFDFSNIFFESELKAVLCECVNIYKQIVATQTMFCNKEEEIRDGFMAYLKSDSYKIEHSPLNNYHFDKESEDNVGRLDIRVLPVNPYRGDRSFYSIECKRLDNVNTLGKTGLNAEYVKNGICRYVSGYYTTPHRINAMFGFVVVSMDIPKNISDINTLLSQEYFDRQKKQVCANSLDGLTYKDFVNGYPYSYVSTHSTNIGNEITLYHLMFDFSNNIA